ETKGHEGPRREEQQFVGRRNRGQRGVWKNKRGRCRILDPSREEALRLSNPGGGVDHCSSIRREAGGSDASSLESELMEDRHRHLADAALRPDEIDEGERRGGDARGQCTEERKAARSDGGCRAARSRIRKVLAKRRQLTREILRRGIAALRFLGLAAF